MIIKYVACKGERIESQFIGLEDYSISNKWFYYWVESRKQWLIYDDIGTKEIFDSINPHIKSVKSAIRHLEKHKKYLPKGSIFRLHNKYLDSDVFITI